MTISNKKAGLIVLFASLAAGDVFAGTLSNYSIGDVLLCFRKTGVVNDLVVDVGPISTFTNATPNQRIDLSQYYTGNQLALVGTNGISWSAFTWYDLTVSPPSVDWTIFVTNPRSSVNTQTEFPPQATQSSQHLVGNKMSPVPLGGADSLSHNYSALSTSTAAVEPDNNSSTVYVNGQSYSFAMGADLNFSDTYGGYPENTTPGNFTLAGKVQRSDFYWIPPSKVGLNEVYLGYFEFNTNGVMTYVAYPTSAPTVPVIQSITRTGNVTSVQFTTGSSGTYTLRGTNVLTAPLANWPAITSVSGNGSVNTLQDTTSVSNKFYIITAQ